MEKALAVEDLDTRGLEPALDPLEGCTGVGFGDEVALDRAQGVEDGGAVAVEGVAELAEREAEALAGEVDRELPAADGLGAPLASEKIIR